MLLDEVEKAHPEVLGLLLQIMEEGTLTDSSGRKINFKNTIIVMTSNVGGTLRGDGLGFCGEGRKGQYEEALRQSFTPEFLGRVDATVCFAPLGDSAMEAIAWKYLRQLQERTAAVGIQLQLPQGLARSLSSRCRGKDGARQLRRMVQTEVEDQLAAFLLRCGRKPTKIRMRLEEDAVIFGG